MKSLLSLPGLPKPGQRLALPPFSPSADALALSRLAHPGQLLMVVTASPLEAQRLAEEIAWLQAGLRVHLLPDWETLPYDNFSPHQDLVSERLATLHAVSRNECEVLIAAASTAVTRLAPPAFLAGHTFFMKKGERLQLDKLRAQLTLAGYQHVTQVVAAGEYSVRGGLVDLFPMGTQLPYRIELFDDEIETIRSFDVDSQRSLYPVPEIRLLPAREFPAGDAGRTMFRQRFREAFEGDASRIALYKDVSNGILPAGIEYYLPLFFESTGTLFDYLPPEAVLALHGDVAAAIAEFWADTQGRHKMLGGDRSRPVLPPGDLFLRDEEFFTAAKALPLYQLKGKVGAGDTPEPVTPLPPLAVDRKADDPLAALRSFLRRHAARPVRTEGRRPGGARRARHRPLPGPGEHGFRRGQYRVPAVARIRRRRQALRAGGATAPDQPLQRRRRRPGAAAQPRQRPPGTRPSARPPSRCATPPPNCCTSTPSAPRAKAHAFKLKPTTTKPLPTASASRKPPTSRPPSRP
jgi:transcription-repair coupling factor (superfamily II helicase)